MSQENKLENLGPAFRDWDKIALKDVPQLFKHIAIIMQSQQNLLQTIATNMDAISTELLARTKPQPPADPQLELMDLDEDVLPDFDGPMLNDKTLN